VVVRPVVIQTENLPQECSDWLAERCDLHVCPADSLRFKELLPIAAGLAIRTYTIVDKKMLELAPKLKVVGRAGVGVDNIDLDACKERGVIVVHTPEANSESVVEFVMTSMLSALRKMTAITTALSQAEWDAIRTSSVTQREFSETTLGIVGFGRVGSRLGKVARAMGFRVIYNDLLNIPNSDGCEQVSLESLLEESDVVSIHVDGRKENHHFCNLEMFQQLKQDVVFMNSSRGFVVDAFALTDFLTRNQCAYAILDVHEPEPITTEYPLLHLPNATLYPHIACKTKTATTNMGWVVKDIVEVLQGNTPAFSVPMPE